MKKEYTEEELKEINERIAKANEFLKKLQLACVANISPVMVAGTGNENVFAFKATPLFADLKYTEKTKEEKVQEILEAEVKEK